MCVSKSTQKHRHAVITFVTTWPTLDKAKDSRVATLQRSGIAAQSLSLGFMKLERKDLGQIFLALATFNFLLLFNFLLSIKSQHFFV